MVSAMAGGGRGTGQKPRPCYCLVNVGWAGTARSRGRSLAYSAEEFRLLCTKGLKLSFSVFKTKNIITRRFQGRYSGFLEKKQALG